MDKFFLIGMSFSVAMHGVVFVHLPSLGTMKMERLRNLEIEFSYLSPIDPSLEYARAADPGIAAEVPRNSEPAQPESENFAKPPARVRGTGEILRARVRDVLKPLDSSSDAFPAELKLAIADYKRKLESILAQESGISYPAAARNRRIEARFNIRFCVRSDGTLDAVEVPSSKGQFSNAIVLGLEKAAAHFPAFPDEIPSSKLTFSWPVSFDLH